MTFIYDNGIIKIEGFKICQRRIFLKDLKKYSISILYWY